MAATRGTAAALQAAGIAVTPVKKVHEGRPHVVDMIKNGEVAMLINTTEGRQAIGDSYTLRRAALMAKLPYYTTLLAIVVQALARVRTGELEVAPLQSYFAHLRTDAPPTALLGATRFLNLLIGSRRVMTIKVPMTPDGHARLSGAAPPQDRGAPWW